MRRNPWLAPRLSRPQVIQLNAVAVAMATCVLHTAALRRDKRRRLDWQIAGKQRKVARGTLCSLEPLTRKTAQVFTEMSHGNRQASVGLIFISRRDRINIISIFREACLDDEGFHLCTESRHTHSF